MEYKWGSPSIFYYVLNGNEVIGTERDIEELRIHYYIDEDKPWNIEFENSSNDYDLEEILLSSVFDIYEVKRVKRTKDASERELWYKYSNCEIKALHSRDNNYGRLSKFEKQILAKTRESIGEKPNFIKE